MRMRSRSVLLICLVACGGCGGCGQKSTDQLIADLKSSPEEKDRIIAVRLLPQRTGDQARALPALIFALKDSESDVRQSAAIALGKMGENAKESIPALQESANSDRDARVRQAARVALSRIDPSRSEGK